MSVRVDFLWWCLKNLSGGSIVLDLPHVYFSTVVNSHHLTPFQRLIIRHLSRTISSSGDICRWAYDLGTGWLPVSYCLAKPGALSLILATYNPPGCLSKMHTIFLLVSNTTALALLNSTVSPSSHTLPTDINGHVAALIASQFQHLLSLVGLFTPISHEELLSSAAAG